MKDIQQETVKRRGLRAHIGLALTLLVGVSAWAQQDAKSPTSAPQVEGVTRTLASAFAATPFSALTPGIIPQRPSSKSVEEEETGTPKKSGGNGIKVHGHWVIDVRNPDGTLAEHRDFENSLTTGGGAGQYLVATGDQILPGLLSGAFVPGDPAIAFLQASGGAATISAAGDPTAFCVGTGYPNIVCDMLTTTQGLPTYLSNDLAANPQVSAGLTNASFFSGNTVGWVLSGNYTVPSGLTSIMAVQTLMVLCTDKNLGSVANPTSISGSSASRTADSPSSCYGTLNGSGNFVPAFTGNGYSGTLTFTLVPGVMPVSAGQILAVKVTITFS
jgi:hypothetical protein